MKNLLLGRLVTNKDENRLDKNELATSRLTTSSAARHNPTSIEHQALDLNRYPPDIEESFQQPRPKGQYLYVH